MSAAEQLVGLLCSWRPSGNLVGRSGETVLFCCCCAGPLRRRGRIIDLSFGRRTVPLVCDAAAEEQVGNVAAAALGDAAADLVGNVAAAGNVVAADDAADFGGAVACNIAAAAVVAADFGGAGNVAADDAADFGGAVACNIAAAAVVAGNVVAADDAADLDGAVACSVSLSVLSLASAAGRILTELKTVQSLGSFRIQENNSK